jgi:DNA-binding transcriptional MerR regulator
VLKPNYTIGVFSKMTGIPVRTLHYYDDIGLLQPRRQESGHRVYGTEDIMLLQKILSLKSMGFALESIKELLNQPKYDLSFLETLKMQQQALETTRSQIEKSLEMVARMITVVQHEGTLEHELLFSLIRNMNVEDQQRKWVEEHFSVHAAASLFDLPTELASQMDMDTVRFAREIKGLYGQPVDSPEVEQIIGEYVKYALEFIDSEAIAKFDDINEEQFSQLDQLVDMPFTDEESAWLDAALLHFTSKYARLVDNELIWEKGRRCSWIK